MNNKLQQLIDLMPLFKEISGKDAEINIWDTNGVVLGNYPSESLNLPFELGFEIHDKTDPIFGVMKSKKRLYVAVPAEVFGESIEGYITPIIDGSTVVGCVTYVFSSEHNKQISESSEKLNQLLSSSSDSLSGIWDVFAKVTENVKNIHDVSLDINKELQNVQTINTEIQKNANYSNILALNASIESARAGAAGKGFAVVSGEMRNFAKISSDSARSINDTLSNIINSLNHIYARIDNTVSITSGQYDTVAGIKDTLADINTLSTKMKDLCSQF